MGGKSEKLINFCATGSALLSANSFQSSSTEGVTAMRGGGTFCSSMSGGSTQGDSARIQAYPEPLPVTLQLRFSQSGRFSGGQFSGPSATTSPQELGRTLGASRDQATQTSPSLSRKTSAETSKFAGPLNLSFNTSNKSSIPVKAPQPMPRTRTGIPGTASHRTKNAGNAPQPSPRSLRLGSSQENLSMEVTHRPDTASELARMQRQEEAPQSIRIERTNQLSTEDQALANFDQWVRKLDYDVEKRESMKKLLWRFAETINMSLFPNINGVSYDEAFKALCSGSKTKTGKEPMDYFKGLNRLYLNVAALYALRVKANNVTALSWQQLLTFAYSIKRHPKDPKKSAVLPKNIEELETAVVELSTMDPEKFLKLTGNVDTSFVAYFGILLRDVRWVSSKALQKDTSFHNFVQQWQELVTKPLAAVG